MMQPETYLRHLRSLVARHPSMRHPFLRALAGGEVSFMALRRFAVEQHALVRAFPGFLETLAPRTEQPEFLRLILEAEGEAPSLVDEYEEFLRSLGVREAAWREGERLWTTRRFVQVHRALAESAPPAMALGALGPGHVWATARFYPSIVAGLGRMGRPAPGYFRRVLEDHAFHAQLFAKLAEEAAGSPGGQALLRQGAMTSLEARGLFLEGVSQEVGCVLEQSA